MTLPRRATTSLIAGILAIACWRSRFPSRVTVQGHEFVVRRSLHYKSPSDRSAVLDLYLPADAAGLVDTARLRAVVLHFQGNGWRSGLLNQAVDDFVEAALGRGWPVVNVDTRAGPVLASKDARCAQGWLSANGTHYHLDPLRIVTLGASAGGHLALLTGMLPDSAGFDETCPYRVANIPEAIVDWYGVTDFHAWRGARSRSVPADRARLEQSISPLELVRSGLPPVITVHGDSDRTVPFAQSERLHAALDSAGVPHLLIPLHGGHGRFSAAVFAMAWDSVASWLSRHGVVP